jgi:hypothetical protein
MTRSWPVAENEFLLNDALDIVMRYFDLATDSAEYASVEDFAAEAIMDEWKLGVRHKIVLANKAIAVIEDRHPLANQLRRARNAGASGPEPSKEGGVPGPLIPRTSGGR